MKIEQFTQVVRNVAGHPHLGAPPVRRRRPAAQELALTEKLLFLSTPGDRIHGLRAVSELKTDRRVASWATS